MKGIDLARAERFRQIQTEGHTLEKDVGREAELAAAARCYLALAVAIINGDDALVAAHFDHVPLTWPWAKEAWHPQPDSTRMLVKATALAAAAIDANETTYDRRVAAFATIDERTD